MKRCRLLGDIFIYIDYTLFYTGYQKKTFHKP